jgi:hypothetical protein
MIHRGDRTRICVRPMRWKAKFPKTSRASPGQLPEQHTHKHAASTDLHHRLGDSGMPRSVYAWIPTTMTVGTAMSLSGPPGRKLEHKVPPSPLPCHLSARHSPPMDLSCLEAAVLRVGQCLVAPPISACSAPCCCKWASPWTRRNRPPICRMFACAHDLRRRISYMLAPKCRKQTLPTLSQSGLCGLAGRRGP